MLLNHNQSLIVTSILSIIITIIMLHWQGYLRHSKEQDSVYLAEFNLIKITPGTKKWLHTEPNTHKALCEGGYLVLEDQRNPKVSGVLVGKGQQVVPCDFSRSQSNQVL